jgi:hypothetical protein
MALAGSITESVSVATILKVEMLRTLGMVSRPDRPGPA